MKIPTITADEEAATVEALSQTVSPSRLSLFHQCRMKFWFRYVLQIEKPTAPALHLGGTVHAALKTWNKARWRGIPLTNEQLKEDYLKAWKEGEPEAVEWEGEEEKQRNAGWSLIETYLRESKLPIDVPPEAVEVPVEADLKAHGLPRLVGVLDLVQAGTIIDYKTAASTPNPEQQAHVHGVQITSYAILYREARGRTESGSEIHTLVKLKTPKLIVTALPVVTEQQIFRLFRQIESYLAGLVRRDWVPSPGFHCSWCEFFDECRACR